MASRYSNKSGRLSSAVEKQIKKINERRAQIKRDVRAGKLPETALKRYEDAIRAAAGDFINKSGNIAHGKKAQAELSKEALDALLQRQTSGQLQKDLKKQVAEEYDKSSDQVTREDLDTYMSDVDFVNEYISNDPERAYDAFTMAFAGKKGIKPYYQLRQAIEAYEGIADKKEVHPFDAERAYFT